MRTASAPSSKPAGSSAYSVHESLLSPIRISLPSLCPHFFLCPVAFALRPRPAPQQGPHLNGRSSGAPRGPLTSVVPPQQLKRGGQSRAAEARNSRAQIEDLRAIAQAHPRQGPPDKSNMFNKMQVRYLACPGLPGCTTGLTAEFSGPCICFEPPGEGSLGQHPRAPIQVARCAVQCRALPVGSLFHHQLKSLLRARGAQRSSPRWPPVVGNSGLLAIHFPLDSDLQTVLRDAVEAEKSLKPRDKFACHKLPPLPPPALEHPAEKNQHAPKAAFARIGGLFSRLKPAPSTSPGVAEAGDPPRKVSISSRTA